MTVTELEGIIMKQREKSENEAAADAAFIASLPAADLDSVEVTVGCTSLHSAEARDAAVAILRCREPAMSDVESAFKLASTQEEFEAAGTAFAALPRAPRIEVYGRVMCAAQADLPRAKNIHKRCWKAALDGFGQKP
jgi:aminoglycoside phosphotransferase (APT) family kinase protein